MLILIILLILMVLAVIWSVMALMLLRAAIALALSSVLLTAIMFYLDAPYAAAFELSVCAGLIPVIFISVISLVQRPPIKINEYIARRKNRLQRFVYLPFVLLAIAAYFFFVRPAIVFPLPSIEAVKDVREVLWNHKQFDLFGQIMVLLAGVYGVLVLFKRSVTK